MPKKTSPQKPNPAPKAFDVFKPGKALASPTSRPVITGHKPKVQDSTLTDKPGKPVSNARSDRELLSSHDKIVIPSPAEETATPEPLVSQPSTPIEPVPPFVGESAQAQITSEPEVPAETLPPPLPENTETPAKQEQDSESMSGQTGEQVSPVAEQSVLAVEAEAPDQASVHPAPAVDTSQIVVSHHKPVGRSKWKVVVAVLIVIILVAVAADILLDAGVWSPTYNIPHTHFFSH